MALLVNKKKRLMLSNNCGEYMGIRHGPATTLSNKCTISTNWKQHMTRSNNTTPKKKLLTFWGFFRQKRWTFVGTFLDLCYFLRLFKAPYLVSLDLEFWVAPLTMPPPLSISGELMKHTYIYIYIYTYGKKRRLSRTVSFKIHPTPPRPIGFPNGKQHTCWMKLWYSPFQETRISWRWIWLIYGMILHRERASKAEDLCGSHPILRLDHKVWAPMTAVGCFWNLETLKIDGFWRLWLEMMLVERWKQRAVPDS